MTHAIRSFAHIGLTVSDLDRSSRYWTEVLGFELQGSVEVGGAIQSRITGVPNGRARVAMVTGIGVTFELVEWLSPEDRAVMRPRPCDVGSAHFAIEVDDIEAVVSASAGHGWALRGTIETWNEGPMNGTRLAYITNDDGTVLEFYQLAPAADAH